MEMNREAEHPDFSGGLMERDARQLYLVYRVFPGEKEKNYYFLWISTRPIIIAPHARTHSKPGDCV